MIKKFEAKISIFVETVEDINENLIDFLQENIILDLEEEDDEDNIIVDVEIDWDTLKEKT